MAAMLALCLISHFVHMHVDGRCRHGDRQTDRQRHTIIGQLYLTKWCACVWLGWKKKQKVSCHFCKSTAVCFRAYRPTGALHSGCFVLHLKLQNVYNTLARPLTSTIWEYNYSKLLNLFTKISIVYCSGCTRACRSVDTRMSLGWTVAAPFDVKLSFFIYGLFGILFIRVLDITCYRFIN